MSATIDESKLKETSSFMFKLLTSVGIVVMFSVGTIIGIQFMVASAEDKAKVKEALIPYVIGCAVIFGAFTIWSIAVNMGQNVIQSTSVSTPVSTPGKLYEKNGEWYCRTCGKKATGAEINLKACALCRSTRGELKIGNDGEWYCKTCGKKATGAEINLKACALCSK